MRASLVLVKLQLPRSCPNEFWVILPFHDKADPRLSFHSFFFISVGPPIPTSKIRHRLIFLALKTCPNCIGPGIRAQKGQRDNFTREPPCLQHCSKLSLTSVSRRPDTHGSYIYVYACTIKTKMSILCQNQHLFLGMVRIREPEHLRSRWRNVWTREKKSKPPDVALERLTKRVIPGFRPVRSLLDAVGPSLLFHADLAYVTFSFAVAVVLAYKFPHEIHPNCAHLNNYVWLDSLVVCR